MHEVLVNRLGGLSLPKKSVARFTDRPDMSTVVYRGQQQQPPTQSTEITFFSSDSRLNHDQDKRISLRGNAIIEYCSLVSENGRRISEEPYVTNISYEIRVFFQVL